MLVYRMEHKEHRYGPFGCGEHMMKTVLSENDSYYINYFNDEWQHHYTTNQHANPHFDGIRTFISGIMARNADYFEVCGVTSLDAILDWFGRGDCLSYLKAANFVVRAYNIHPDHVKVGKRQVAFNPAHTNGIAEEIEL